MKSKLRSNRMHTFDCEGADVDVYGASLEIIDLGFGRSDGRAMAD